jgi:prephenate dehydrogenase
MGAWLTEELCLSHEVCVHDVDPAKMRYFIKTRRILDPREAADFDPELLINCVPLGDTVASYERVLPLLPDSCAIADIASIKTGLADYYAACGRPFASTHPMFGPTFANIRDLSGESAVVIAESDPGLKRFFSELYSSLGISLFEYSFEEHDRMAAYSLGTPFASTMVFAACMEAQKAPGTNFKRHLAIAKGLLSEDDRLISEIMFNPYTIRQLELINSKLSYLTHIIRQRDHEEMAKFLGALRENIGNRGP